VSTKKKNLHEQFCIKAFKNYGIFQSKFNRYILKILNVRFKLNKFNT